MSVKGSEDEQQSWQPKILAFCCNWCSYAGADLAGTSRLEYPANVKIIRVPCSSRVSPQLILRALQRGADGVMVAGCHPGDCHYVSGNYYTRRRMMVFRRLLAFMGIEPQRLEICWIAASEGQKFSRVARELTAKISRLGPSRELRSLDHE